MTALWARPRWRNTVDATNATHETPKPIEQTQGDDPQHRLTLSRPTYWSVGQRKKLVTLALMVVHAGEQLSTRDLIINEALRCFAEIGLRRHLAQRHRRRCRHPPAQPAAPLPVEGSAVPRGLRAAAQRLVRAARRGDRQPPSIGWEKVELVIGAGFDFFADNHEYVRLMRREALDGGAHLGIDLAAVLRPMWDRSVDYFRSEMEAGVFRQHDPEQLLLTGYGALLSYFSDAPFLGGLLDEDPLAPDALLRRRDHITAFFRTALVP